MVDGEHTITLVAPPDDVDTVHELLAGVWAEFVSVSDLDRARFETALIELASNVIQHASFGGVRCDLTVEIIEGRIEARLSDTGEPGNIDLAPRSMPEGLAEAGRGLALIQVLVDEVEYSRLENRNHWRISRTLES